jgi:DNA polymerase elongation subunit (family B)
MDRIYTDIKYRGPYVNPSNGKVFNRNKIIEITVDENGERHVEEYNWKPSIFLRSDEPTIYKDLYGKYVRPVEIDSIFNYREKYSEVQGMYYCGDVAESHQYIREKYPEKIENYPTIPGLNVDIECFTAEYKLNPDGTVKEKIKTGFPLPQFAKNKITSITCIDMQTHETTVLSIKRYQGKLRNNPDIKFEKCNSEEELLIKFWMLASPYTILSGWNCLSFDYPYLINRSKKLGVNLKSLLPLGYYTNREFRIPQNGGQVKTISSVDIPGFQILDYMLLFGKFNMENQENYKLDTIATKYLNHTKIDYSDEYTDLDDLYFKNFDLYIEYNIRDVELLDMFEKKFGYIQLAQKISYLCKINLSEFWYPTRFWDVYIYNAFMDQGIVPPRVESHTFEQYPGAFVKEPIVGFNAWIVPFDVKSLYPNLIISANMSPLSIKDKRNEDFDWNTVEGAPSYLVMNNETLDGEYKVKTDELVENNVSQSTAGYYFDISKQDPLAAIVEGVFNDRVNYQKLLKAEKAKDNPDENLCNSYKQLVYSLKIMINSLYGSFGNQYFRYFDLRIASSITTTGQYLIQRTERDVNKALTKFAKKKGLVLDKPKIKCPITGELYYDITKIIDTDSNYFILEDFVNDWKKNLPNEPTIKETCNFIDMISAKVISPVIDNTLATLCKDFNFFKNNLQMNKEAIYDSGLSKKKKHYMMSYVEDDGDFLVDDNVTLSDITSGKVKDTRKLNLKGIDIVKTSTPTVVRNELKKMVRILLDNRDEDELRRMLKEYKKEYMNYDIIEIAFPRSARKCGVDAKDNQGKLIPCNVFDAKWGDIISTRTGKTTQGWIHNTYKPLWEDTGKKAFLPLKWATKTPVQVRAMWSWNLYLQRIGLSDSYEKLFDGDKIRFVYLLPGNPVGVDVVALPTSLDTIPDELNIKPYVDKTMMWDKTVIAIMDGITQSINWNLKDEDEYKFDFKAFCGKRKKEKI